MGRCCKHKSHTHVPFYTGKSSRGSPRPERPCCTKRRPKSTTPPSCAEGRANAPPPSATTVDTDTKSEPAVLDHSTSDVTDLLGEPTLGAPDTSRSRNRTPIKPKAKSATRVSDINARSMTASNEYEYYLYVFLHPRDVDKEILPFTRRKCIEEAYSGVGDNARLKEVLSRLSRDDRRLAKVELNSLCQIALGDLHGAESCFRGLPRRKLIIKGPSYCSIALAINMMEENFPRLMRHVLYPYPLPTGTTTKYETDDAMARTVIHQIDHETSNIGLREVFDDRPVKGCSHLAAFVEMAKKCS